MMRTMDLFTARETVGLRLKDILRQRGYTKVSFCNQSGLSRPTLDKLLQGKVESRVHFEKHMAKIMNTLHLSDSDFLVQSPRLRSPQIIYSANVPDEPVRSPRANEQFDLLGDLIDLCDIYY